MSDRRYEYLLSLGSNVDSDRAVPLGIELIARRFNLVTLSPWYDVPAVGPGNQPRFVNLGARICSDLAWPALRSACRRIEEGCGRRRDADRSAPRTLDLDVVFAAPGAPSFGRLPHADLLAHAYVLCPCAEAWPEALHPHAGRTLADLAAARFPSWEAAHRRSSPRESED